MADRDCKNCRHYVLSDMKHSYNQNGCGTYDQPIYSCEKWECKFEPRITANDYANLYAIRDFLAKTDEDKASIDLAISCMKMVEGMNEVHS